MTPDQLEEIIGHLGAALIQRHACDDEIILDHIKAAQELALKMYRERNRVQA